MSFTKLPKLRFIETRNNTHYIEWINYKENRYNVRAACYFSKYTKHIDNLNHINKCKNLEEHKIFISAVIRQAKLKNIRNIEWVLPKEHSNEFSEFLSGYGFRLDSYKEREDGIVSSYTRRRYNGS